MKGIPPVKNLLLQSCRSALQTWPNVQ